MGRSLIGRGKCTIYHWFLSIALLSVLLAACGGTPSSQTAVMLRIMDYSPEQSSFHNQVAAEYHKSHPNVTIQWQSIVQAQYQQAIPLAFQSHQAPDIFFWKSDSDPTLTMAALLKQGWIRPLGSDGNVPQSWKQHWSPSMFQEGINVSGGKVYGFPFTDNVIWGPGYMYYSKALFQAAGLDPANPPTTWNQLKSDCEAIKTKTGKYCLATPLKGSDPQRTWFALAGSIMTDNFFDYKNGTFDLSDPKLVRVFDFIQSLYQAGLVVPGVNDKSIAREQMASGQAAIYFDGSWMPSTFNQLGFDYSHYGIAPPPYPDGGPRGAFTEQNTENKYWISSQTQHPAEAWDFIQWMTQPDGFFARQYLKGGFGTLAYTDNQKYLTDPAMQAIIKIASNGLRVKYPEPVLKCPGLAKSQAFLKANQLHPNWEWQTIVSALVNHKDFASMAQQVVTTRQQMLVQTLQKEQGQGLKVSISCFTYPSWNYNQNYSQTSPSQG